MGRGLVLGGGGVTGIAWELGVLAGLAEAGVYLRTADLVVGTSAGSVVGAQIRRGQEVEALYQRQLEPPSGEIGARFGPWVLLRWLLALSWGDEQRSWARLGRMALRANTVPEAERRAVLASRLPFTDWPEERLVVTAIVAETGEFLALDGDSGVSLLDAVAASCAVPLVWPPMTVVGRRCIDGGIRSPANIDLAAGCDPVVVLAPILRSFRRARRPSAQLAALGSAKTAVVTPDDEARAQLGSDPLDPALRAASARAGRAQAARVAAEVAAVWAHARSAELG
jgi:NTE family protein